MLFRHAQGCELRSTLRGGIRSPDEPELGPKKRSARLAWAKRQGPEILEQVLAERTPASLF